MDRALHGNERAVASLHSHRNTLAQPRMNRIIYLKNPRSMLLDVTLPMPCSIMVFYKLAVTGGPESLIQQARPSSVGAASQVEVEKRRQRVK